MRKSRIRNAYTKFVGKEWYKKMQAAKQAKADKVKREKTDPLDLHQPNPPQKKTIDATSPTAASKMEENTSPTFALNQALNKLREQAKEL